jgi:hypothetical protein
MAGTSAVAHSAGATVRHVFTGKDAQEAGDHVGDSTLHWNSTNTATLELPWQWSKPGAIVTGLTTADADHLFGWPDDDPGGPRLVGGASSSTSWCRAPLGPCSR